MKVKLCAACGKTLGFEMYELKDGSLICYNDDCLKKATGVIACVATLREEEFLQSTQGRAWREACADV